jgi:hypothetical protein|tara:strand:- start:87 stop:575 length:489 start_codon:yes stop_codon:yes gene_type:complete
MIKNIKIILFILLIMIISVIFIIIINKYTEEEKFTELSDTLAIQEVQKKANLIDNEDAIIASDDKTLNEQIKYISGPTGPRGDRGPIGPQGGECKCKMPLLKFIDEEGNILAKYPENNYPSIDEIIEDDLVELTIPVPSGNKGETGSPGVIGPGGFGYPSDI